MKWYTIGEELENDLSINRKASDYLDSCGDRMINLVAIFGKCRQGKSFLLNGLAGDDSLFEVNSSYSAVCTSGANLSKRPVKMPEETESSELHFQTLLVDCQGNGNDDVTLDAKLVTPLFLLSDVVIFNWFGRLQKDEILNALAVISHAAKRLGEENPSSSEASARICPFGHLIIVLRDAPENRLKETELEATKLLFEKEEIKNATKRNNLRDQMNKLFKSVSVLCFPMPHADCNERVIEVGEVRPAFQSKLDELLKKISACQQRANPTDPKFNGPMINKLLQSTVDKLNWEEAILPTSLIETVQSEELKKIVDGLMSSFSESLRCLVGVDDNFCYDIDEFEERIKMEASSVMEKFDGRCADFGFPCDLKNECKKVLEEKIGAQSSLLRSEMEKRRGELIVTLKEIEDKIYLLANKEVGDWNLPLAKAKLEESWSKLEKESWMRFRDEVFQRTKNVTGKVIEDCGFTGAKLLQRMQSIKNWLGTTNNVKLEAAAEREKSEREILRQKEIAAKQEKEAKEMERIRVEQERMQKQLQEDNNRLLREYNKSSQVYSSPVYSPPVYESSYYVGSGRSSCGNGGSSYASNRSSYGNCDSGSYSFDSRCGSTGRWRDNATGKFVKNPYRK